VPGTLGRNWQHSYEMRAIPDAARVDVVLYRGRTVTFERDGGSWRQATLRDAPSSLLDDGSGGYLFGDTAERRVLRFDSTGALTWIEDLNGNRLTVARSAGRIDSVSDAEGNALTFQYDTLGRLRSVTDGTRTCTFTQSDGNLVSATDASGATTTYEYDGAHAVPGLLTRRVRPEGNIPAVQTYDAAGRVATQIDAEGGVQRFTYDTESGPAGTTTVTLPGGGVRRFGHDADGNATSTATESGAARTIGYDSLGRRVDVLDRTGRASQIGWDDATGRRTLLRDAAGGEVAAARGARTVRGLPFPVTESVSVPGGPPATFEHDARGNLTSVTARDSALWTYQPDGRGLVEARTGPSGETFTFQYDASGRLVHAVSPTGTQVDVAVDAFGRVERIVRPGGAEITYTYDACDRLLTETDANGDTTVHTWDANGNLLSTEEPGGERTVFEYDALDRAVSVTEPSGAKHRFEYDALGRLARVEPPTGGATSFRYDANGYPSGATDPTGRNVDVVRDAEGRVLSEASAAGADVRWEYDAAGRVAAVQRPAGGRTTFEYDAAGRLVRSVDPAGREVTTTYDAAGRPAEVDVGGLLHPRWEYDASGGFSRVVAPGGAVWEFETDVAGRPTTRRDPLGRETTYAYDADTDRLDRVAFPGGADVQYQYDDAGRVTRRTYSGGPVRDYEYDSRGRVVAGTGLSAGRDADGRVVASNGIAVTRNAAGDVTELDLPGGRKIVYTYDAAGRVLSLDDGLGGETAWTYDGAGRATALSRPNGVTTRWTYDDAGLVLRIEERRGNVVLADTQLARNAAGEVVRATRRVPVAPELGAADASHEYAAASQRTDWSYDPDGRLLSDGDRACDWDGSGSLVRCDRGTAEITYEYDCLGRRIARDDGSAVHGTVWCDALRRPVPAVDLLDGTPHGWSVCSPDGELLHRIDETGARSFCHYDENGNTIGLTDDEGQVTGTCAYDPFGGITSCTGMTGNPYLFRGRECAYTDPDSGFVCMGSRWYDPESCRYVSPHLAAGLGGACDLDPYAYARGNPCAWTEPTGVVSQPSSAPQGPGFLDFLSSASSNVSLTSFVGEQAANVLAKGQRLEAVAEAGAFTRAATTGEKTGHLVRAGQSARQSLQSSATAKGFQHVGTAAFAVGGFVEGIRTSERADQVSQEVSRNTGSALATLEGQLDALFELRKKGLIDQATYNRRVAEVKAQFNDSVDASLDIGFYDTLNAGFTGLAKALDAALPVGVSSFFGIE